MFARPFVVLALTLLLPNVAAQDTSPDKLPGAETFRLFCAACHQIDKAHVGPSLVEIAGLYRDRVEPFVAWCNKPEQKRKGTILMPSMRFVGDDKLRQVHAFVLAITKGKKEVAVKGADRFRSSPTMRKRPLVQRTFMPKAGPAAIAVAVDDELHYCWDAGSCRLRYVWRGDFIDNWPVLRANGNALAKVVGDVWLREPASPLPFARQANARFLGYRMRDGLPTFRYRLGKVHVEERISRAVAADGKPGGLSRRFVLRDAPNEQPLRLDFHVSPGVRYSSKDGSFSGGTFTPSKAKATDFTIVMTEVR